MIQRKIQDTVIKLAKSYPVITITGPRQAGKTTLAQMAFYDYSYCNLEYPEIRIMAQTDPESFFRQYPAPVIIDEIQHVPELMSYIQVKVDENKKNGMYVLTGSQNVTVNASITQSLAGRTALISLLPFSIEELRQTLKPNFVRDDYLYYGFMPRIYDQQQEPTQAYRNYLHTYVERDIRQLLNVKELTTFENFLRLLAGRTGQLINKASLANDTGVSATTISHWLSILEASFIIYRLYPYYQNIGKRVIKSPKLYFTETGLACYLLGIENARQVARDPLLGSLFENMVVMEAVKARANKGLDPNLFFYRDSHHNEVDLIYKKGSRLIPVEIKAAMTYNKDFIKAIQKFQSLDVDMPMGYVIYGGDKQFKATTNIHVKRFETTAEIFD